MNPVELFGKGQKQSGIGREEDTHGPGVLSLTWGRCQCAISALCDFTMGCFCNTARFHIHFLKKVKRVREIDDWRSLFLS